jgi:uncharacterized protein (TIGR02246 family)
VSVHLPTANSTSAGDSVLHASGNDEHLGRGVARRGHHQGTTDAAIRAERLRRLSDLQRKFDALPVDDDVDTSYGELAAAVAAAGGQPRSRAMDVLIAATAHAHSARLYTRNVADFARIEHLSRSFSMEAIAIEREVTLSQDVAVSNDIAGALTNAWNQHDMRAFASQFHIDAAFVNIRGAHLRGRDEIEQQHTVIHGGVYKASTARFVVADSREVVPGLIVFHLSSEVQDREGAEGETQRALMTSSSSCETPIGRSSRPTTPWS